MLSSVIDALYFFLPAYVANTCAVLFGRGAPLDLGRNFLDGRRLIGDGVTIRGSLGGMACGTLAGLAMALVSSAPGTPGFRAIALVGFLLSFGAIFGDACGSFLKRRMGIPRGGPAFPLDQLNFVVGALLFSSIAVTVPLKMAAILFLLTPIGHALVTRFGYKVHMKEVPW